MVMMWVIERWPNKGTPAKLRLSKNKRVITTPPSPELNQHESDADDRRVECEEEETGQESSSRKAVALQTSFLHALRR
jgi:hypothetical protein